MKDLLNDRRELQVEAAMRWIMHYLNLHPNASDSRRGVQFWLRDAFEMPSEDIIGVALDRLVERREIMALEVAGGTVVYRLAPGMKH